MLIVPGEIKSLRTVWLQNWQCRGALISKQAVQDCEAGKAKRSIASFLSGRRRKGVHSCRTVQHSPPGAEMAGHAPAEASCRYRQTEQKKPVRFRCGPVTKFLWLSFPFLFG